MTFGVDPLIEITNNVLEGLVGSREGIFCKGS